MRAKAKQRGWKSVTSFLTGATLIILTALQISRQRAPATEAQLAQIATGYGLIAYGRLSSHRK